MKRFFKFCHNCANRGITLQLVRLSGHLIFYSVSNRLKCKDSNTTKTSCFSSLNKLLKKI